MSPENDLIQQGIAAYEAGDIDKARELLTEGVRTDQQSEIGWLYLAKTQTDRAKRRAFLEKVLDINGDNIEASAMLAMLTSETKPADDDMPELDMLDQPAIESPGIDLPPGIPGAPERLTAADLKMLLTDLTKKSMDVLLDKPDSINPVTLTWWHLLFMTLTAGLATGAAYVLQDIFSNIRALNIFSLITTPFLTALTTLVGVAAGCYLSHWFLTTQRGGKAPLFNHSAVLISVWFPATMLNILIIGFEILLRGQALTLEILLRGEFFRLSGGWLIATLMGAVVVGYALYLSFKQLMSLYFTVTPNSLWIAAGIMLAVVAIII